MSLNPAVLLDASNQLEDSASSTNSSCIIRVRRKRTADPETALLVHGVDASLPQVQQPDDETTAGPSKRLRPNEPIAMQPPAAFRLIGTLPIPDVRDAARLFLPNETPKVVDLVDVENIQNGSAASVVPVHVDDLNDVLMQNVMKVDKMDLGNTLEDPFLAVPDEAPLARPESGLEGDMDEDYVYDFYHAGTSVSQNLSDRVHVRLPTDEELQLYFGGDNEDADSVDNEDDADSNAENYYRNDYPDEDEFEGDNGLENDTTSDDSYDHYGDEEDRDYNRYVLNDDESD
ncbi:hypothetical protein M3Y98_01140700 [Aphelenchoides besseyi]|nr:hypothetical protein M3Y98_01140700 [Aphelenchoides besseyi]